MSKSIEKSNKYHVVMYSSGISSYVAAKRVADKYGTENLILLFADTQIEDKDNYRFLLETSLDIGAELVIVSDGRTPWDIAIEKKWLNHRSPYCSSLLKIKPCEYFLESDPRFNQENTYIYFGIDWQEYHRMDAISKNWAKYSNCVEAPLCWGDDWLDKNQCFEICNQEGIKPPRLYSMGFSHSNCGGFCIKAGKKHFRRLYKHFPDLYIHHENKEQEFKHSINNKTVAILRETIKGKKSTVSLKEFRQRIENEPKQQNLFGEAEGGCGCFLDNTE